MPAGSHAGGAQPTEKKSSGLAIRRPALVAARRQHGLDAGARFRTQALVHGGAIPAARGRDEQMDRALGIVGALVAGAGGENKREDGDPLAHGQG
jgi:hypothetical protein